jgi:hypothetical protein
MVPFSGALHSIFGSAAGTCLIILQVVLTLLEPRHT